MRLRPVVCLAALATSLVAVVASAQTPPAPAAPPAADAPASPDKPATPDDKAGAAKDGDKKPEDKKPEDKPAGDQGAAGATTPDAGAAAPGETPPADATPPNGATQPGTTPPVDTAPVQQPPAPAPPAPAPAPAPPVTPAPSTAPSMMPAAASAQDQGGAKSEAKLPPPEQTLGIELEAGPNFRLDSPDNFTRNAPVGLEYGLGGWFAPSRVLSVGLAVQQIGLGSGRTAPQSANYDVERSLTALWLGGRAYPLRSDTIGLFVQLQVGMSWQHVRASGTQTYDFSTPKAYDCSASQGPGFGLGGGVGMDVDLDRHLAFIAQADLTAHRLSSDAVDLDGCAPGAGSETNLGARIGFMYRFDMDEKRSASARRKSVTSLSF